jgi:hypothetical protein
VLYLVVLSLRLAPADRAPDPHLLAEGLADALMALEETATVWLRADGRSSRVALDIEADDEPAAGERAETLVTAAARGHGLAASELQATVGTDRERLLRFAREG